MLTERSFARNNLVSFGGDPEAGSRPQKQDIINSEWVKPTARPSDFISETVPSHLEPAEKQKINGSEMSKDWRTLAFKLNYGLGERRESWKGDYL